MPTRLLPGLLLSAATTVCPATRFKPGWIVKLCEVPTTLEQRVFALARAIQQTLN